MAIIDVIFLIILGGFVLFGWWFGLVHALGALVGTVLGIFLASRWYEGVASWASQTFAGSINVWKVVAFIVLFIIINRLVGFLFHILEKIVGIASHLPFLKTIDRMAGAVFGFFEGALVLGSFIFIASKFPFDLEEKVLATSALKGFFLSIFNVLLPFVPEALRIAEGLIKK